MLRAGGIELEQGARVAVLAFERVPETSAAQPGDAQTAGRPRSRRWLTPRLRPASRRRCWRPARR